MRSYVKSKEQYWKERNRRKRAWILSNKGLTEKEIAEQLGVSERTVQRDLKKIRPFYRGRIRSALDELQAERNRKFQAMLEGKTDLQKLNVLTKLLIEHRKIMQFRDYVRHLMKVIIDMDDITGGCPKITFWPRHWSGQLPIHIRFVIKHDGEKEVLGDMTLDRSH